MDDGCGLVDEPAYPFEPAMGATLTPRQVIGRDVLVARCWTSLKANNSLLLLAPRRVGKTSICTLIEDRQPEGFVVCRTDMERYSKGREFDERTAYIGNKGLGRGLQHRIKAATWRASRALKKIKLTELEIEIDPEVELADSLARTLEKLEASCEALDIRLVLIWDELPLFIDKLIDNGNHADAETILDGLRAHRAENAGGRLRMIYTGSIGFPEVLERLSELTGHRKTPTNDMQPIDVPLLDEEHARELVAAVLWTMGRPIVREKRFVSHAARACEGHPFVIQWLATELRTIDPGEPLNVENINRLLDRLVNGDSDPLDLEHYLRRLDWHGWGDDARAVLDVLAPRGDQGATIDEIDNVLPSITRSAIVEALRRLRRDGYITKSGEDYRFRLIILARWWTTRRGLAEG